MRFLAVIFIFVMISTAELPALASVTFIGEFSNVRYTEEHAYGSSVQLWREGDKLFGLFYYDEGLQGDTPRGLLEDIHFNPASGKLSFSAKLSVGVAIVGKGKQEPSRDFFTFEGVLHESSLSGKLTRVNKLDPKMMPEIEDVKLLKLEFDRELIENITSLNSWKKFVDPILKFRGPKW